MLVDYIINRAKRTPYFHLAGYMNRWWLVPFESSGSASTNGCVRLTWRRPFAKILQLCGIAVRVHEVLRSDTGRDPHDHPWPFVTVVLRGGYYEWRYDAAGRPVSRKWHGPGSVLFRRATDLHMLELPVSVPKWDGAVRPWTICATEDWHRPATTLFITGRYKQRWGFMTPQGKVPHNEYEGRQ